MLPKRLYCINFARLIAFLQSDLAMGFRLNREFFPNCADDSYIL
jgi:hypothetical protein